jgi:release factor glutamine methyltransferase
LPRTRILATDRSPAALEVARGNAVALGVENRVDFACADVGEGLRADRRFDVVVSNPPYLAEGDPTPAELAWEPAGALTAGSDGLDVIRRLLRQAVTRLRDGGSVVMEMGLGQEVAVCRLAEEAGLVDVSVRADYAGIPRVLIARAPERSLRG